MKKFAILGIGNCGSQIANLAYTKYPELFTPVFINSSDADLAMVKSDNVLKFKIGESGEVEGSGKNREKMQSFLRPAIINILTNEEFSSLISTSEYCFVCSSTAGGTGSGSALVMMEFLRRFFTDTHFILVSVLPKYQASMLELMNTLEFLQELYVTLDSSSRVTYMMYDNETVSNMSPTVGLTKVNESIVEDIRILTGVDCYPTPYDSIDDADMESLITTPGRLMVCRIPSSISEQYILSEKKMEDNDLGAEIIKSIKKSNHTEFERDHNNPRRGIITYLTPAVGNMYSPEMPKLDESIGVAVETFQHNAINETGKENLNFLYIIASGLSPINDRSQKIKDRVEELRNGLPKENAYALGKESISSNSMRKNIDNDAIDVKDIVVDDIFAKFQKK